MKYRFAIIILSTLLSFNCFSETKVDTTKSFYGINIGISGLSSDLNSSVYSDIYSKLNNRLTLDLSVGYEYNMLLPRISFSNFKTNYLAIGLGLRYNQFNAENDVYVGNHFLFDTLNSVYLQNTTSINLMNLEAFIGMRSYKIFPKIDVFGGLSISYIFTKKLQLESKLINKEISIVNENSNLDLSNQLSPFEVALNVGMSYQFYQPKDSSYNLDLTMNLRYGLNDLFIDENERNGSLKRFGINVGIQLSFNKKVQEKPKDTIFKIRPLIQSKVINDNNDSTSVYVDNRSTNYYYFLDNKVKYNNLSEENPNESYKMMGTWDIENYVFNISKNHLESFEYDAVNYDILNIYGYKLRFDSELKLTLNYPVSAREIGKDRAKKLSGYFTSVWGINAKRISLRTKNIGNNEIELNLSENPNPFVIENQSYYQIDSKYLQFEINPPKDKMISSANLQFQHFKDGGLIPVYDTAFSYQGSRIIIPIENKSDFILGSFNKLEYRFIINYQDGTNQDYLNEINLKFNRQEIKVNKIIGKFSVLLKESATIIDLLKNKEKIQIICSQKIIADEIAKKMKVKDFEFIQSNYINSQDEPIIEIIWGEIK